MSKYFEIYNNCNEIAKMIKAHACTKGHEILSRSIDVFVGDEATNKYFVDFEAKNKAGKYYRVYGNYTTEELKKMNII